jgi:hypothetical protein
MIIWLEKKKESITKKKQWINAKNKIHANTLEIYLFIILKRSIKIKWEGDDHIKNKLKNKYEFFFKKKKTTWVYLNQQAKFV